MTRNIFIGIGAGLAAALLFASVISGTSLAFPLFALSALPVAIAGIGFGTWSGAIAAALSAVVIGAAFSPIAGLLDLALFGAPVAFAAHLVGLSRPSETPPGVEWFPLADVLTRLTLAVAIGVAVAGVLLGFDPAVLVDQTVQALEAWFTASGAGSDAPTAEQIAPIVRFNIALMPATSACFMVAIAVLNCWLGAHIARMSGILARGWTPMWRVVMPRVAGPVFGVALVASFLPGGPGHIAAVFAGAIGSAFAITGYGCLHALLRGRPGRFALLFFVYALSFVFLLPVALIALLGIADSYLLIRERRLAAGAGPSP